MMRRVIAGLVCAMVAIGDATQAGAQEPVRSSVWKPRNTTTTPLEIGVNWNEKEKAGKVPERITPKRAVSLRIEMFNFVYHEPEINVDAKAIPGYAFLESLWGQVLGLQPAGPGAAGSAADEIRILGEQSPFLRALEEWRRATKTSEENMKSTLKAIKPVVALTPDDTTAFRGFLSTTTKERDLLDKARASAEVLILAQFTAPIVNRTLDSANAEAALKAAMEARARGTATQQEVNEKQAALKVAIDKLTSVRAGLNRYGVTGLTTSPIAEAYYAQSLYDAQLVHHKELVDKMKIFIDRLTESLQGRSRDLDSQKAGTIVTVTIRPKPVANSSPEVTKAATKAGPIVFTYYVQSEKPLMYHLGAIYTRIQDFDYEKVQKGLAGDVFQRIEKSEGGSDLIAMMTYLPLAENDNYFTNGFGLTIGTGVKNLGQRLYLGGSFTFFDRLILNGGKFSQTVTTSDGNALSATTPNLFEGIKKTKEWGWYFGLSATPF